VDLQPLSALEADAIITARETSKANSRAAHLAELEKAPVKSEGRGVLPSGQEIIVREVKPPANVGASFRKPEPQQNASTFQDLAPEGVARIPAQAQKTHHVIMLSATVFDKVVSRLSWKHENQEYVAFANADFNLLRSTNSITTEVDAFTFFMGIGDADKAINPYADEIVPHAGSFSTEQSEYIVIQGDPNNEVAFAGIEALLKHYDENLPTLKIQHQRSKAFGAAQARFNAKNPETPEPFIMQFWVPEKRSGVLQPPSSTNSESLK